MVGGLGWGHRQVSFEYACVSEVYESTVVMRVSWVASGAIIIVLGIVLYVVPLNFNFFWITPSILMIIGIIVLVIGLVLPETPVTEVHYEK